MVRFLFSGIAKWRSVLWRRSVLPYRCNLLVEACLEVLREELARNEAVLPHRDHTAVVDGIAQLGQGHVKFVHSINKTHNVTITVTTMRYRKLNVTRVTARKMHGCTPGPSSNVRLGRTRSTIFKRHHCQKHGAFTGSRHDACINSLIFNKCAATCSV